MEPIKQPAQKASPAPAVPAMYLGREVEGGLPEIVAAAGAGKSAFGEMNDDEFAHAFLQQGAGGMAQSHGVEVAIGLRGF